MTDLDYSSGIEIARLIRSRQVSAREVTDSFLEAIEARNPAVNAYVAVLETQARLAARRADQALHDGEPVGPLHGVPLAIKDLFDFKAGVPATLGSRAFKSFVPDYSATYVERLERAGAIVLGKTNTPEFGHKGTTDNLLFGSTKTPFDLSANAGGSSGGSAAAVAEGLAPLSQGSDGGGSVRIPAALCGVFGLKPSIGRVASVTKPNLFIKHTPFLHPGPITRTVEDAALMLDVMAGPHPQDPFSLPDHGVSYLKATKSGIKGLRIAYSSNLGSFPVEPAVADVVDDAVWALVGCGAEVEEVAFTLPYDQSELSALWQRQIGQTYVDFLCSCEADGIDLLGAHRDELDPNMAMLFESARELSFAETKRDDVMRSEVYASVQALFANYDLLVTPVLSVERVPDGQDGLTLGPRQVLGVDVDPFIGWCLTYPFNFTGHPAASVPAGLSRSGHPIGLQIVGPRFRDDLVLSCAAEFGRARPWRDTYRVRRGGLV
jgi:amidase/aspartyl-tRNA(Asn)/glutamyl-tRNA(Gln) amidotransferase subunit A